MVATKRECEVIGCLLFAVIVTRQYHLIVGKDQNGHRRGSYRAILLVLYVFINIRANMR